MCTIELIMTTIFSVALSLSLNSARGDSRIEMVRILTKRIKFPRIIMGSELQPQ